MRSSPMMRAMPTDEVNLIRNSRLAATPNRPGAIPRSWEAFREGAPAEWRSTPQLNGDPGGMALTANRAGTVLWRQRVRLKSDEYYRVEALVSVDCPADEEGGLVLRVNLLDAAGATLTSMSTRPLQLAVKLILRGYLMKPENAVAAEISIGLVQARGTATVHEVRVLPIIEPDANSHPTAVPPPAFAQPAPVRVQRVCVITDRPDRPVIALLRARFGDNNVTVAPPRSAKSAMMNAEAIVLPDHAPPAALNTLRALRAASMGRIVVASVPMMAHIVGDALSHRTVSQPDDPLHARIGWACYATAGFALHDIIPFSTGVDHDRLLWQRQFRNAIAVRQFCRENGFEVLLDAETNRERTSDQPMALIQIHERGALLALDVEPVETAASTLDEPDLAAHLLVTALGGPAPVLGQFIASPREPKEMLGHARDLIDRYDGLYWVQGEQPRDAEDPYLVGLGRDLPSVGLNLPVRPLVLIRTALSGADISGAYGAIHWLRQLLRPPPFACPYRDQLNSRFRIAWMPQASPFTPWGGWAPEATSQPHALELEFEPKSLAACIDVTSTDERRVRLVLPKNTAQSRVLADTLPQLASTLLAGRYMYLAGSREAHGRDRTADSWRVDDLALEIAYDERPFREQVHAEARRVGATLLRFELPATSSEGAAQSIWLTDWAATLLELSIGLLYGLIVVNRDPLPLEITLPAGLADLRDRLVLRPFKHDDVEIPIRPAPRGRLVIPPGHALVAARPIKQ